MADLDLDDETKLDAVDQSKPAPIDPEKFTRPVPDADLLTDEERSALEDNDDLPDMMEVDDNGIEVGTVDDVVEPAVVIAQPAPEPSPPAAPAIPAVPIVPAAELATEQKRITEERAALQALYQDGEVTDADYTKGLTDLAKAEGRVELVIEQQQKAVVAAQAADDAAWNSASSAFKAANPVLYSQDHIRGFNDFVEMVTANPRHAQLNFTQQLQKAAQLYAADAGQPELAKGPAPAKPVSATPAAPAAVKPQREAPPPTLARMPAATENDTDGGLYAQLDRIMDSGDAVAAERALSRLTKEQREAYGSYDG